MLLTPVPNDEIKNNDVWLKWFNNLRFKVNQLLSWFTSTNNTRVTVNPFLDVPGVKTNTVSVTVPHATSTTVFTIPGEGLWMIGCYVRNALPGFPGYYASGYFGHDGGGVRPVIYNDTFLTLTMSGNAVQVTQLSGVSQAITVVALRIF